MVIRWSIPDVTTRKDAFGTTALHDAASKGMTEIVLAICQWARIEEELVGPKGFLRTVVNVQDNQGWSALHVAVNAGNERMVADLLSHGADLSLSTNDGWTARAIAVAAKSEVMILLLDGDEEIKQHP